jgi:cystathionine beta-lyase/cystathionine gamma-synthase
MGAGMKSLLTVLAGVAAFRTLSLQVLAGKPMDRKALARARRYLDTNPDVLEGLKAQGARFPDPNVREAWNSMLAQCQAVHTEPPRNP